MTGEGWGKEEGAKGKGSLKAFSRRRRKGGVGREEGMTWVVGVQNLTCHKTPSKLCAGVVGDRAGR